MGTSRTFNREAFASLWNDHTVPTARIARAMGISRQGVSWHAHKMGLRSRARCRLQKHDPELLREMWLAGVSSADIARHFGMAHHGCAVTAAHKAGLPYRKRGKSGKMNGGWEAGITLAEFFEAKMSERMVRVARAESAALEKARRAAA